MPPPVSSCQSLVEENNSAAQEIISTWDSPHPPSSTATATQISSLFPHYRRRDLKYLLKSVTYLQQALLFYGPQHSTSQNMIRAQNLTQAAMKILEKEFYQILTDHREDLGQESSSSVVDDVVDVDDERDSEDPQNFVGRQLETVSSSPAAKLRAISDCMISSGYGKECVKVYRISRKSFVEESLYRLGFEHLTAHQLQKLEWEAMENRIRIWTHAVRIAVKHLFYGERSLSDHVFAASDAINESCFSEISAEAATNLLSFPESLAKCKNSPEKMFRFLDVYAAVTELSPEIHSIFSFESTSAVRKQAATALTKLGEPIRVMLADFEKAIQKDTSKSPVPGGGLHPVTRYVMNYFSLLADYTEILIDIFSDWTLQFHTQLPETLVSDWSSSVSAETTSYCITSRIGWIILVLLCKLDGKAGLYKDVGLAYLFLANNLTYVIAKVKSSKLLDLLGDDLLAKHEARVRLYAASYEKMAWSKVTASLPAILPAELSAEGIREAFRSFDWAFEEAYRRHSGWVVPDRKLREEIKISVAEKIVPKYREFYGRYGTVLRGERVARFTPEDIEHYLSELFNGGDEAGSATSIPLLGSR